MRLIDADALIPTEVHTVVVLKDGREQLESVLYAEQVDDAPTVEPASPWRRVEEKPDEHTNLWLHDERGNYHVGCVSTYRGYTEYIDMGGNTLHDIDYWMPIEPPQEDA